MSSKSLKSQDVLVLLKLLVLGRQAWTLASLSDSLGLSTSEVLHALRRSEETHLYNPDTRELHVDLLVEAAYSCAKIFVAGDIS